MTDTIAATKLTRFGLTGDVSNCLVEFQKLDGETQVLSFPSSQLEEVLGLLLQVKQIHAQKTEGAESRSVLVAERVGVLAQSDAVLLDFVVGGAPISFALPRELGIQLAQVLKERLAAS